MRLEELRKENGLSQYDVAKAINTSQTNIGRWEKGKNEPSASYITKLAFFFKVSTDYLLGISDDFGNITIKNETPAPLQQDEQKLLEDYRKLSPDLKNMLHGIIDTWTKPDETAKKQIKKY